MDFIVRSGKDETQYDPYYMHGSCKEGNAAINKWRHHIWNNFAARMLWTTTNNLIYRWSVYSEPGSYQGDVKIEGNNAEKCKVHIPSNTAGKNIHIILELTDEATPALTVYRRVVLKIS